MKNGCRSAPFFAKTNEYRTKQIAVVLKMSVSAVNHQKERIRDKSNVSNSAQLGYWAAGYFADLDRQRKNPKKRR
jgi:hypothetical protein